MADGMNDRKYTIEDHDGFAAYQAQQRAEEQAKARPCYVAEVMSDGKLGCPVCGQIEGGTMRIITHRGECINNGKPYCVDNKGGRRRRRRKSRRSRRTKGRRKTKG